MGRLLRGDATAKLFGRMTLNPIVHFDLDRRADDRDLDLPRRVPDRLGEAHARQRFNNLRNRRNDEVLVALAGPASNLVMAALGAIVVRIVVAAELQLPELVLDGLFNFVVFNVMLAIFNLIPIPPLDGSTLLYRFLPPHYAWQIRPFLAQYGIFILLAFVLLSGRLLSGLIYGVALSLMGLG